MEPGQAQAVAALARLPSHEIALLLPFLTHPLCQAISETVTNILFYKAGTQLSRNRRAKIRRVVRRDLLPSFKDLTLIRMSQKQRRSLMLKLRDQIGEILSGASEIVKARDGSQSERERDQKRVSDNVSNTVLPHESTHRCDEQDASAAACSEKSAVD